MLAHTREAHALYALTLMTKTAACFHYMIENDAAVFLYFCISFIMTDYHGCASDTFSSSCNISQSYDGTQTGAGGLAAGSKALVDSVDSEQRGLPGSKVMH